MTELWPEEKLLGHNFQEGADLNYPKIYTFQMDL